MLIGETVGRYVGELKREKLEAGRYRITGPRGSCVLSKAREKVFVRSWARSRAVTMTVWNPSNLSVTTDSHGLGVDTITRLWGKTLNEAVYNLVPILCSYRSR